MNRFQQGKFISYLVRILFLLAASCFFMIPALAFAGQLDEFEQDIAKPDPEDGRETVQSDRENNASASGGFFSDVGDEIAGDILGSMIQGVFGGLFSAMGEGGSQSARRVDAYGTGRSDIDPETRKPGEALLPFLRLDALYQDVQHDVAAGDLRIEASYGPFGFQVRRTAYHEKDPITSLEITQYYFLYRMSSGTELQVDLGAGEMAVSGNRHNTGFSVILPVLYHPSEFFGIEFRPAWSSINENTIQDLDIAVLFGMRYVSVKAGYRWMKSPHQSLDGPEIGLSMRW